MHPSHSASPVGGHDVLISVDNVSKKFCRSLKKSLWYGVCDIARDLDPFARNPSGSRNGEAPAGSAGDLPPLRDGEFWAVQNVSFQLRRGECLGLIGRNGAGKTTLLKMLNGLIKPDTGSITMRGRVGALIALGAGFNPILSGRENIYVNASVLGLSKAEVNDKIDEIIDFADMREFIDAPVQSYSSGMSVRLGFAVATALNPDVLLLDEVLAVGDAAFRHKCYHRICKLMSSAAVILVSHSMDYIGATCGGVALMKRGRSTLFSDAAEGIAAYYKDNRDPAKRDDSGSVEAVYPPVQAAKVRVLSPEVPYGGRLSVEVELDCKEAIPDVTFSFSAVNHSEQTVMAWHTSRRPGRISLQAGRQLLRFHIDPLLLHDGTYRCNFHVAPRGSIEHVVWFIRAIEFTVTSPFRPVGNIPYLADTTALELTMLPDDSPRRASESLVASVL